MFHAPLGVCLTEVQHAAPVRRGVQKHITRLQACYRLALPTMEQVWFRTDEFCSVQCAGWQKIRGERGRLQWYEGEQWCR
jgi:hypothetical protein